MAGRDGAEARVVGKSDVGGEARSSEARTRRSGDGAARPGGQAGARFSADGTTIGSGRNAAEPRSGVGSSFGARRSDIARAARGAAPGCRRIAAHAFGID